MKFGDIKQQLLKSLELNDLDLGEPVTLVDGFLNPICTMELDSRTLMEGPSLPIVVLLGDSGQLYFFSLYALIS